MTPKAWTKAVVLMVLLALLWCELFVGQVNHLLWGTSRDGTSTPTAATTTFHRANEVPQTHRFADTGTCRPPTRVTPPSSMEPKVPLDSIRHLAQGGYNEITKGSGNIPQLGPILTLLSHMQFHNLSMSGSVGEIGVHHGHFTSFLFATARANEDLVVADLFEDLQDQNIDFSGHGNKQKFLQGMTTYGLDESSLHTIHTGSSADLPMDWSQQQDFAPFRLFSIDGGHTAELTFNDLQVAFCNLMPGGIIALDDFFHAGWPGVTEGFFQFLLEGPDVLAPVKIYPILACKGKLFMTNDKRAYETFVQGLSDHASDLVKPYARGTKRGWFPYKLNGVNVLKCVDSPDVEEVHKLWESLVF